MVKEAVLISSVALTAAALVTLAHTYKSMFVDDDPLFAFGMEPTTWPGETKKQTWFFDDFEARA